MGNPLHEKKIGQMQVHVCKVSLWLGKRVKKMLTNRRGYRQSFFSLEVTPPVTIENISLLLNKRVTLPEVFSFLKKWKKRRKHTYHRECYS